MTEVCTRAADLFADADRNKMGPELAAHVESCAGCREQMLMHQQLEQFQRTPVPQLSPGFAQRVTRLAVAQEHAVPLGTKGRFIEVTYAIACVAVMWALLRDVQLPLPRFSLPGEALPWLVPAGFALAMAIPAMLRAARRVLIQILA